VHVTQRGELLMTTKEARQDRFIQSVMGDQRKFPWPWHKTAEFILGLRKGAQLEGALAGQGIAEPQGTPEAENEDIVRGLLQVHQQQQQTVAAAEAEGRMLRTQLDQSKQQLQNLFMQNQQQQAQMQQLSGQAQQAVQQARMQAEQAQQMAGPEIQKAQQEAAMAQQQATQARIEQSKVQQLYEQTRRAVLDYKGSVMQAVSQDPVTLAEAQKMQQDQAMAAQAQQQAAAQPAQPPQAAPEQGGPPPEQGGGMTAQAAQGSVKTAAATPVQEIARAVAGQGERAGYRRALAEQYLSTSAQQGAKAGQGGTKLPFDSLAAEVLKQGHMGREAVKVAMHLNSVANDLRRLQGGSAKAPDASVLEKIAQVSTDLNAPGQPQAPSISPWAGLGGLGEAAQHAFNLGGSPAAPAAEFPQFAPYTPQAAPEAPQEAAAPIPEPQPALQGGAMVLPGFGTMGAPMSQSYPIPAQTASAPTVSPAPSSAGVWEQPSLAEKGYEAQPQAPAPVESQRPVHHQPGEVTVSERGGAPTRRPAPPPGAVVEPKEIPSAATPSGKTPPSNATVAGQQAVQRGVSNLKPGPGVTTLPTGGGAKGPGVRFSPSAPPKAAPAPAAAPQAAPAPPPPAPRTMLPPEPSSREQVLDSLYGSAWRQ
jgi:hypothetical protein